MASRRRRDTVDLTEVGIYACVSRCVRRGRFMGYDPGGLDVSHRRFWVLKRLQDLVTVFAVELLDYGILDNSLHTLVRIRPDLTPQWSDEEVARRWRRLNRQRLDLNEAPLRRKQLLKLLRRKRRVQVWRSRLSDPSWFMIMLKEPLARAVNREDRVSGHFFGERFSCEKCETLEDTIQASLFANMTPIQAGLAVRPDEAEFTSFRDRLEDARVEEATSGEVAVEPRRSGWLAPLSLGGDGHDESAAGRRPTNDGFLPFGLKVYARLLESCRCGERSPPESDGETQRFIHRIGLGDGEDNAELQVIQAILGTNEWFGFGNAETQPIEDRGQCSKRQVLLPTQMPELLAEIGCDANRWAEAYRKSSRRFDKITRQTDDLRSDFDRAARGSGE